MPDSNSLTSRKIPELLNKLVPMSVLAETKADILQAYPEKPAEIPRIVWSIYHRVPGRAGHETLKPRYRRTGTNYLEFGKWQTVFYQFDCFAQSPAAADRLMESLEDFLDEAMPAMETIGVETFVFDEETKDQTIPAIRGAYVRTVRYKAVFTETRRVPVDRIQSMLLSLNMTNTLYHAEITRSSTSNSDTFVPEVKFAALLAITDNSEVTTDTEEYPYIAGIDFIPYENSADGSIIIEWKSEGKKPSAGSIYYVTYTGYADTMRSYLL